MQKVSERHLGRTDKVGRCLFGVFELLRGWDCQCGAVGALHGAVGGLCGARGVQAHCGACRGHHRGDSAGLGARDGGRT